VHDTAQFAMDYRAELSDLLAFNYRRKPGRVNVDVETAENARDRQYCGLRVVMPAPRNGGILAVVPPDQSGQARAALKVIVDEHGPEALASAGTMSNLLKDLLPDTPRIAKILVAAAEDRVAVVLREHVVQGLDATVAARLTASSFAEGTMFAPEACAWAVGEFAVALGLLSAGSDPVSIPLLRDDASSITSPAAAVPDQLAAHAPTVVAPLPGSPAGPPRAWTDGQPTGYIAEREAHPLPRALSPVPRAVTTRYVGEIGYVVVESDDAIMPLDLLLGEGWPPIHVGRWPRAIALTPDNAMAYVACGGDAAVTPVDLLAGVAGQPIRTGPVPSAIAITPDGTTALVACTGDGTITPVNLAAGLAGQPIRTGPSPSAIAITPDGATAYVVDDHAEIVTPVSIATGRCGYPVHAGAHPVAIAIAPDGLTAYIANFDDGTLTAIDLSTGIPADPIPAGSNPFAVAITPDGLTAYVANHMSRAVTPVDLTTGRRRKHIKVGKLPYAITITSDGSTAYVANYGDRTVTPIDIDTSTGRAPIRVGNCPAAIAITGSQPLDNWSGSSP